MLLAFLSPTCGTWLDTDSEQHGWDQTVAARSRLALLRVTDVQRDADGNPDQVTADAVVWVRLHTD
ncbi:hypothetical protein ACIRVK_35395 [Streptomyces sp. NPDC101152]|uniref:hypothetical protein n=1 Tax=Streptomyces sp. NPDC101152 TaxID=3366116 RepID=UPI00381DA7BE